MTSTNTIRNSCLGRCDKVDQHRQEWGRARPYSTSRRARLQFIHYVMLVLKAIPLRSKEKGIKLWFRSEAIRTIGNCSRMTYCGYHNLPSHFQPIPKPFHPLFSLFSTKK